MSQILVFTDSPCCAVGSGFGSRNCGASGRWCRSRSRWAWSPPRGADLPAWRPTRLNLRLHRLLMLADLVLDQVGVEHRIGDIDVHGYRLWMSWLFERLMARLGLDTGHLIYASPSAIPEYRFVSAGITLRVHRVDLTAPVTDIEEQLHGVLTGLESAGRVRDG